MFAPPQSEDEGPVGPVDEIDYEVTKITAKRIHDGVVHYCVHWKGYEQPSWEPIHNLNCPKLIEKFENSIKKGIVKDKVKTERKREQFFARLDGIRSENPTQQKKSLVVQKTQNQLKRKRPADSTRKLNNNASPYKTIAQKEVEAADQQYAVDMITNERFKDGVKQYFVKWVGYPEEYDSWEPASGLRCNEKIFEFRERKKARAAAEKIVVMPEMDYSRKQLKEICYVLEKRGKNGRKMYAVFIGEESDSGEYKEVDSTVLQKYWPDQFIKFLEDQI